MFNKKRCLRCNSKVSKDFTFCPNCGTPVRENADEEDEEEWGMLGKEDIFREFPETAEIKLPMGFNSLFNSLMNNLDQQFKELDKEFGRIERTSKEKPNLPPGIKRGGISISISTAPGRQPEIKVHSSGNMPEFRNQEKQIKRVIEEKSDLPIKRLEKFSELPRKEPSTNIRRLSDKVIYEIELPGVKSLKDVSIIKLENSIEIKAVAKDKAYFKLIPINLPIISKRLTEGKLVLELEAGN